GAARRPLGWSPHRRHSAARRFPTRRKRRSALRGRAATPGRQSVAMSSEFTRPFKEKRRLLGRLRPNALAEARAAGHLLLLSRFRNATARAIAAVLNTEPCISNQERHGRLGRRCRRS